MFLQGGSDLAGGLKDPRVIGRFEHLAAAGQRLLASHVNSDVHTAAESSVALVQSEPTWSVSPDPIGTPCNISSVLLQSIR